MYRYEYLTEVNKGSINMRSFTNDLNKKGTDGWRLAHVYAHALAHSVSHDEHLSWVELRHIAGREASVVEAAIPPLVALLLGALDVLSTSAAVWTAFVLGLVVLGAQGIVFARVERLGATATIGVVAANLGLGLVLVGLKVLVTH